MLNRVIGFLTGNKTKQRQAEDGGQAFLRLNEVAPIGRPGQGHSPGVAPPSAVNSVVCREAVLGRDQKVAGYSFMLRRAINERMRASSANVQRLYDEVLLGNIRSMEIQRLLEHRLAFIPISPASLSIAVFQSFPREGVVFVTGSIEQLIVDRPETLARLAQQVSQ